MSNPWTKKEEEVLVKQRKEGKTLEEIKNNYFPDRTLDSIIHKAKRLIPLQERRKILKKAQNKPIPKLSKEAIASNPWLLEGSTVKWSNKELELLIKGINEGLTNKQIQGKYLPLRTVESIKSRRIKLTEAEISQPILTAKEEYIKQSVIAMKKDQDTKINAKWELLENAIKECMYKVKKLPCLVGKYNPDLGRQKEVPILMLTDLHIGEKSQGKGEEYNKNIFQNRLAYLISKVIHIKKDILDKAYNLPELKIFMLGDEVTNECLFPSQPWEIDMPMTDQIILGSKIMADNLNVLSQYFTKITIHCVSGNHGRISKFHNPTTSWDYFFYKFCEASLQNNPRIEFIIEKNDWKQIIDIMGNKFLLFHGDRIKMQNRTPHYGIENAVARWVSMFHEDNIKYFCLGHFHTAGMFSWNRRKIILGGTFLSGSQYAEKEIKLAPSISQWFFGCAERGITWSYELDLEKIGEPTGKEKYYELYKGDDTI